jgi:hypothetical protein
VYVAARRIRDLQGKETIHPANTILLGEAALKRFYGPTIWGAHSMSTREFDSSSSASADAAVAAAEGK